VEVSGGGGTVVGSLGRAAWKRCGEGHWKGVRCGGASKGVRGGGIGGGVSGRVPHLKSHTTPAQPHPQPPISANCQLAYTARKVSDLITAQSSGERQKGVEWAWQKGLDKGVCTFSGAEREWHHDAGSTATGHCLCCCLVHEQQGSAGLGFGVEG